MTYETVFILPALGDGDGGRVVSWLKQPGDEFAADEPVLEVETDKAVIEVPASTAGKIIQHLVQVDDLVELDDSLAKVELEGDPPEPESVKTDTVVSEEPPGDSGDTGDSEDDEIVFEPDAGGTAHRTAGTDRIIASPYARKLARENAVSLSGIAGSGKQGRIVGIDIKRTATPASDQSSGAVRVSERLIETSSGPLFTKSWELRDGASRSTMILLHGLFADVETWSSTATLLARESVRVIAIDLPNHGRTESEVEQFTDVVGAVNEALEQLVDGSYTLVGHSYGGAIAARVAGMRGAMPGALGLISPVGLDTHINAGFLDGMTHADSIAVLKRELRKLTSKDMSPGNEFLDALHRQLSTRATGLAGMCQSVAREGVQQVAIHGDLEKMNMPKILIHGLEDRVVNWKGALTAPASVGLHLVPMTGHMPQWESSGLTVSLLVQLSHAANASERK